MDYSAIVLVQSAVSPLTLLPDFCLETLLLLVPNPGGYGHAVMAIDIWQTTTSRLPYAEARLIVAGMS